MLILTFVNLDVDKNTDFVTANKKYLKYTYLDLG